MPISDELKLVFVHVPKNAGTAIEACCKMRASGHKPWHVYAVRYPVEWREYRSFAVIRDPVERFISCFRYARMERSHWHTSVPGESAIYGRHPDYDVTSRFGLDEFVQELKRGKLSLKHPGWHPQASWVCQDGSVMVDEVIRYDDLAAGVARLGVPSLPRMNVSEGNVCDGVMRETLDSIAAFYQVDYDVFTFLN